MSTSQGNPSQAPEHPLPAKQQLWHALWLLDQLLYQRTSKRSNVKVKMVAHGEYESAGYEAGSARAEQIQLEYLLEPKHHDNNIMKPKLELAIKEVARREKWNDLWAVNKNVPSNTSQLHDIINRSFHENSIWFSGQAIEVYFAPIGYRWAKLLAPSKIAVRTDPTSALVAEAVKLLSLFRIKHGRAMTTAEAKKFYSFWWAGNSAQLAIELCGKHLSDQTEDLLKFGAGHVESAMDRLRRNLPQSQPPPTSQSQQSSPRSARRALSPTASKGPRPVPIPPGPMRPHPVPISPAPMGPRPVHIPTVSHLSHSETLPLQQQPSAEPPAEPPARGPAPRPPPSQPPSRPPAQPPSRPPAQPPSRPPAQPPSRPPAQLPSRPPAQPPLRPPAQPPSRPPGIARPSVGQGGPRRSASRSPSSGYNPLARNSLEDIVKEFSKEDTEVPPLRQGFNG